MRYSNLITVQALIRGVGEQGVRAQQIVRDASGQEVTLTDDIIRSPLQAKENMHSETR